MRTRHVVECAVPQILETSGDAGRRMILRGGNVDDLGDTIGDNISHVRPRLQLTEKIGLAIHVQIVSRDVTYTVFDTNDAKSSRQDTMIAANIDLESVPARHHDRLSRHTKSL